jgi:uncharacterized metal-binding protein YceD (DUF177 family)
VTPELSRIHDVRRIGHLDLTVTASEVEREALAKRFALLAVERLKAELTLTREGETVGAAGRLTADVVQTCAVTGEPLATAIDEPLLLRFVPAAEDHRPDEEIELDAKDCDEIEFSNGNIDVGEAVAQSLGLAIDPYACGPEAEAARIRHGLLDEESAGPFAALAALKKG